METNRTNYEQFLEAQEEIGKVILGQKRMIRFLLMGLLADGHILLEGVPGLAKTTAVRAIARIIKDVSFKRIQFTPDLLPADLTGTLIYNHQTGKFHTEKGPVFSNFVLADEINRAPAKVQSALLEAMQERNVTIGHETFDLPKPFLVLATQNPIEQEGTYPLPEAQVDRFMFKVLLDYPDRHDEGLILDHILKHGDSSGMDSMRQVLSTEWIEQTRREISAAVTLESGIKTYILRLVDATRIPEAISSQIEKLKAEKAHQLPEVKKAIEKIGGQDIKNLIRYGASTRAVIYLARAAKVAAFMNGKAEVLIDEVKTVAHEVLRHRIMVTFEAEADEITSDDVITLLLNSVPTGGEDR